MRILALVSREGPTAGRHVSNQENRSPPAQYERTKQISLPCTSLERMYSPTNEQMDRRPLLRDRYRMAPASRQGNSFSPGCASKNASWLSHIHEIGMAFTATLCEVWISSQSSTRPQFLGASCNRATRRKRWASHCSTTAPSPPSARVTSTGSPAIAAAAHGSGLASKKLCGHIFGLPVRLLCAAEGLGRPSLGGFASAGIPPRLQKKRSGGAVGT
mmetsp:Transcript_30341/g.100684  ORF Transcript_30341/g.100684 Transcript_30341/m.100684 type:complete len:216 (+) Transcript_30341:654-1301(+)